MKKFVVVLLAVTSLATGSMAVYADSPYPDEGQWNRGVGITGSYSDYFHHNKTHSATVSKGSSIDSHKTGGNTWAKSRLTTWSGCSFFWNIF